MARWTEWFIKRASFNDKKDGNVLVVCGSVGTGKSYVGTRVREWFESYSVDLWYTQKWPHPPRVAQVIWSEIVEAKEDYVFENAFYDICSADIIILDDVGSECDRFKSGQNKSRLRRTLDKCEHKWLMVNANYSKEVWPDVFDVRVADRLGLGRYLDVSEVPSYRPKLRNGR